MTLGGIGLLALLGSLAGLLSGLLGIGGGILMVPLLLYVPPLLGEPVPDMKSVAGITMVQSLAASLMGTFAHGRRRVYSRLVITMGTAVAAGALAGSLASYWVDGAMLAVLFAALAMLAGTLLLFPVRTDEADASPTPPFSRPGAVALGAGIGLLGGMVGQGGGFMIVPGLIYLLRIPTRVALGSSLAIGLISGLAGFAGKVMTAQIPLWPSVAVVAGALIGSLGGSRLSQRVSQVALRRALAVIVMLTALRMGWDLLPRATPAGSLPAGASVQEQWLDQEQSPSGEAPRRHSVR